jgi:hypothetical protein
MNFGPNGKHTYHYTTEAKCVLVTNYCFGGTYHLHPEDVPLKHRQPPTTPYNITMQTTKINTFTAVRNLKNCTVLIHNEMEAI